MFKIDISEDWFLQKYGEGIFSQLLKDHTTQQNIYWATDSYAETLGKGYTFFDPITIPKITGEHDKTIRPRAVKSREEQAQRAKDKAEVFTPSWICNAQNNLIDEAWFGRADVFNRPDPEDPHGWIDNEECITFPEGKTWHDYVADMRMEITCGEAPYLVSRADAVTAEPIENMKHRIGLLDRKLRIVSENTDKPADWLTWGKVALRSTYGFEWQGDNLLLAREAVFMSFIEHYVARFGREPNGKAIPGVAYIISWNLWQMDGLTYGLPGYTPRSETNSRQLTLDFFGAAEPAILSQEHYCLVKDFLKGVDLKKPGLTNRNFSDGDKKRIQTFRSVVEKKPTRKTTKKK